LAQEHRDATSPWDWQPLFHFLESKTRATAATRAKWQATQGDAGRLSAAARHRARGAEGYGTGFGKGGVVGPAGLEPATIELQAPTKPLPLAELVASVTTPIKAVPPRLAWSEMANPSRLLNPRAPFQSNAEADQYGLNFAMITVHRVF
jgi:hypothetical protein